MSQFICQALSRQVTVIHLLHQGGACLVQKHTLMTNVQVSVASDLGVQCTIH